MTEMCVASVFHDETTAPERVLSRDGVRTCRRGTLLMLLLMGASAILQAVIILALVWR